MHLNPVIEKFYISMLDYAGLESKDNVIVNKEEYSKMGDITVDDHKLALPYHETLKNPGDLMIFHPLHENYTNPETTLFNLYKRRLVVELNLKLSSLFVSLIAVCSDVNLQQRIKSSKLINLISSLGEINNNLSEKWIKLSSASAKVNKESYIFDLFLKKNGEVNDTPYAAIGKINFVLYEQLNKELESNSKGYKVYDYDVGKNNILSLINMFKVVFPDIDTPDVYSEGTDNKIFRYLNVLLKTSYQISARMNEIAGWLDEINEPVLKIDGIKSNLEWTDTLEKLYEMSNEIRMIPNQTDVTTEAKKLKIDESKSVSVNPATEHQQPQGAPQFNPRSVPAPQQVMQPQQAQQPQQVQQQPLSPEEIIRGSMNQGMMGNPMMMQGMMPQMMMQQPMMMNPGMMQPQIQTPTWMARELMQQQQAQPQQQMMAPGMMIPQGVPQQMVMQGMMPQMMNPNMMIQQPQNGMMSPQASPTFNPHFMTRTAAPWM